MNNFSLDQIEPNKFVISGSITFESGSNIAAIGKDNFKGLKTVELDFSKITTIDSAILAVLLDWRRFFQANNIGFVFLGAKHNLKVLLKSYGLADLFVFYD